MKVKREAEEVHIRKVWGGFCWPGDSYGHCCVVGEALVPIIDERKGYVFPLYYLEGFTCEHEGSNELLDSVVHLTEKFNVERWYGRGMNDRDNSDYLKAWNRGIRSRSSKRVNIRDALNTNTDKIKYQLQIIGSCLQPGEEILRWTKGTKVEEEGSRLSDIDGATCREFPALAACGYVVSMLRALMQRAQPMFG